MNLDGFSPKPETAKQYKKSDGVIISVIRIGSVNGKPFVLYDESGRKNSVYKDGWNNMQLTEARVGGESPPTPPKFENTEDNSSVKPDGPIPDSTVDKVKRLQELLNNGPTTDINPNFYHTDFSANAPSCNLADDGVVRRLEEQLRDIQKLREPDKAVKAGWLNELLWICAGVDKPLLRSCQSDWSKKAGIGGTILGTAILALLSGTYAVYAVSGNMFMSMLIGVIWGLFIFNLDRYLVNSMYSDGTSKITSQEWKSAAPRLIIAVFIGIVISTPIEMMMFNGKIQDEIQKRNQVSQSEDNIYASNSQLFQLKKTLNKQQILVDTLSNQMLRYRIKLQEESCIIKYGSKAKAIDTLLRQTTRSFNVENNKLEDIKKSHDSLYATTKADLEHKKDLQNDFSTRLQMMLMITGKHYTDCQLKPGDNVVAVDESTSGFAKWWKVFWPSNSLFWARLLIMCFFMIIEIAPVLAKMMADNGKYEEYLILESKTMDKLRRVREANDINAIITSPIGKYSGWILDMRSGHSILDLIDDKSVLEANASILAKEDDTTKKRRLTDADNLRIYEHALHRCTEYIISQIDEIFDEPVQTTVSGSTHTKMTDFTDKT